MTTTAVYSATMPELRGDPTPSSLWSNYNGPIHMTPRMAGPMEPGLSHHHPSPSPHPARPRSEQDVMAQQAYPYGRYPQEEAEPYNDHSAAAAAGLGSHPGYAGAMKRTFSQTESSPNPEMAQDARGDDPRTAGGQDQKLLSFRRPQDKLTITDQHGRLQRLDLSAQLHGMFFLSEMPSSSNDGTAMQPELTCYRRNLFQISGSLITPRGPLTVITETGENVPINNMEVTISAIESVDANPVRLVVIPWKTPPPNSSEVAQPADQEPHPLPLIPLQDDGSGTDGDLAVYPIGWRRLQFRIATANNGRRKELQQHFVLHLRVRATLADNSQVILTESTTAPIVVRGRSPRNFQARKEIPLLGSSAGSRGQTMVEAGMGIVAGPLSAKQVEAKQKGGIETRVPRSAFTFEAPKPPGGQGNPMRPTTYPPHWGPSSQGGPLPQAPNSSPGPYAATTMPGTIYPKMSISAGGGFNPESQDMTLQTTMPPSAPVSLMAESPQPQQQMRPQYPYTAAPSSTPRQMPMGAPSQGGVESRFMDDTRPTKRSRGHQSSGSIEGTPQYRYGPYGSVSNGPPDVMSPSYATTPQAPTAPRDVYPPPQAWKTAPGEPSTTMAYASSDGRTYAPQYDQYRNRPGDGRAKEGEPGAQVGGYSGHRGSFDGMGNYSWSNP